MIFDKRTRMKNMPPENNKIEKFNSNIKDVD